MQPLQLMSGCLWAKKGGNRGNGERRAMATVRTGGLVAFEVIFYFFFSFFFCFWFAEKRGRKALRMAGCPGSGARG